MSNERSDTRGKGLQAGKYTFTIASPVLKGEFKPGVTFYDFQFLVKVGNEMVEHQEKIAVWLAGPLLRAIGAKEIEDGVFEWDKEAVTGIMFDAEIVFEKNEKTGKSYRKMKNPVAIAGFPKNGDIQIQDTNDEEPPF